MKTISIIFLLLTVASYSQDDTLNNSSHIKWDSFITNVPSDIYNFSRISFENKNLPYIGAISAATTALILTDKMSYRLLKSERGPIYRNSHQIIKLGDGRYNLGLAALFSAYGFFEKDDIALRTGMQTGEAIISTGITVQLLKRISGRESPLKTSTATGKWRLFPGIKNYQKNQPKYYSFPSGHLSTAAATLTVLAENYPDNKYLKPVGYSLLTLLSMGLVSKDMHWVSDFPLAFAIGYGYGKLITSGNFKIFHKSEPSSKELDISFEPLFTSRSAGLSLILSFN